MSFKKEPINAILLGAGNRGANVYGRFALTHPWLFRFSAVADPNIERRDTFARLHGISSKRSVDSWEKLLDAAGPRDVVFICTPDRLHHEQTMAFMDRQCAIVLEKPAVVTRSQGEALRKAADGREKPLIVCHVLRYTPFFMTLKKMLDEGRIGKLISINLQENIGYYHFAHSYVRGNWRAAKSACPSILAKSVHDMDILYWLADSRPESVVSMGELSWFKAENAPDSVPQRCMDGCPAKASCPWYAPDLYLTENTGWPASTISDDPSLSARVRALETGPYGRCVFRCDNDVADRQSVLIRFDNGVGATFSMNALTADISRVIQVTGSRGEAIGNLKEGWLETRDFLTGCRERIGINAPPGGHNGGDDGLMNDIAALFDEAETEASGRNPSRIEESLEGHWMAFAAEESRERGVQISMNSFTQETSRETVKK